MLEKDIISALLRIRESMEILNRIIEKTKHYPYLCNEVIETRNQLFEIPKYYLNKTMLSESDYVWIMNNFNFSEGNE